jgi:uncharacterized protein (DUF488 family)
MRIFTLGTAGRQHFDFTKILNKYGIQIVMDIRRSPASPQSPQFNRDSLQMLCASQRADYLFLGNDLGRSLSVELRPSALPDRFALRDWLASAEFQQTLKIIAGKAERRATCILCAERLPDDCQRFYLAQELAKLGFGVSHIIDETRIWSPPAAEQQPTRFRAPLPKRRPQDRSRDRRSGRGPR